MEIPRLSKQEIKGAMLRTLGVLALSTSISAADATPTPNPNYLNRTPVDILSIHAGSESIDSNNLTPDQIEKAVNAMVEAVPNQTHISIGTYLDYPDQIQMWANAAHKRDKNIYLRSAGFNSWHGTFDSNASGTPTQHIEDFTTWIGQNHSIFIDGDIVEPVPDEASNGRYWLNKYGEGGIDSTEEAKAEFNDFIITAVTKAREAFDKNGQPGVVVEVFNDNLSVIKDVITDETAKMLSYVGTDNYPESDSRTPEEIGAAMLDEVYSWKRNVHPDTTWNMTIGPSIYEKLDENTQRKAIEEEIKIITAVEDNVRGITLWQFGNEANEFSSSLFDFNNGEWKAREATIALTEIEVNP